jgi:hypothetical protein
MRARSDFRVLLMTDSATEFGDLDRTGSSVQRSWPLNKGSETAGKRRHRGREFSL